MVLSDMSPYLRNPGGLTFGHAGYVSYLPYFSGKEFPGVIFYDFILTT